jgi:hypothetical protein
MSVYKYNDFDSVLLFSDKNIRFVNWEKQKYYISQSYYADTLSKIKISDTDSFKLYISGSIIYKGKFKCALLSDTDFSPPTMFYSSFKEKNLFFENDYIIIKYRSPDDTINFNGVKKSKFDKDPRFDDRIYKFLKKRNKIVPRD